jgi:hypothetical protein
VLIVLLGQIGFLTEWQMYAQKIEGDAWKGEILDRGKIDKMSGIFLAYEEYTTQLLTRV